MECAANRKALQAILDEMTAISMRAIDLLRQKGS